MYLKSLFQQSKCWFAAVVLFIACQLFINLKKGMVFSPFFHYGMYSEVMKPQPAYPVFSVIVNGDVLQTKDFTPQQWDKIIQPVVYYSKHQAINTEMWQHAKRITGTRNPKPFTNRLTKNDFIFWYQRYLAAMLHKEIFQVNIDFKTYQP